MIMAQGCVGIYFQYRWVSSLEASGFVVGVQEASGFEVGVQHRSFGF